MSAFTGPQGKGAMRAHRARKREQATERDAALGKDSPRRRQIRAAVNRLDDRKAS